MPLLSRTLRRARSRTGIVLTTTAILIAVSGCGSGTVQQAPPSPDGVATGTGTTGPTTPFARQLAGAVDDAAAMAHLQALQRIADEHGGTRSAGTPGYDASVEYVAGVLRGLGFDVSTPTFDIAEGGDAAVRAQDRNVLAQTRGGDPGRVVMIGAHLDSVPEGPGIVDNGSGVAALLEIATRLGADPPVRNAVRFAFFGDEESGAEGSTAYVESLPADELARVALYLNVDMVASPNAGYFVQGGVGGDEEESGPEGSATVGRVLADQLTAAGVTRPEIIAFVGDDESPFVEAGIPVGGAENGDAEQKTAEQARTWGGQAGVDYDRCYHQACDRIDNVNPDVLDHYLRAVAGTLAHFATSPDPLR